MKYNDLLKQLKIENKLIREQLELCYEMESIFCEQLELCYEMESIFCELKRDCCEEFYRELIGMNTNEGFNLESLLDDNINEINLVKFLKSVRNK